MLQNQGMGLIAYKMDIRDKSIKQIGQKVSHLILIINRIIFVFSWVVHVMGMALTLPKPNQRTLGQISVSQMSIPYQALATHIQTLVGYPLGMILVLGKCFKEENFCSRFLTCKSIIKLNNKHNLQSQKTQYITHSLHTLQ